MKICLAASGGGHMRQLLDLEPFWRGRDCVFVTEPTAMGESVAQRHACEFVPHVALGQAKLGHPLAMLRSAFANLAASWRIVARHRPDLVITTGAGSMAFTALFAKLRGAKLIVIDSFARFDRPSAFARIAGPIADWRIAQSPAAARAWNDAECHDPLVMLDTARPAKEPLLFATVGATLPYDRLLDYVGDAKRRGLIPERVVMQTGVREKGGGAGPIAGVECIETLDFDAMRALLARADIAVCHGGTGSIITALQAGCRTIAIPRLFERGEHYDNHQLEITEAFERRGLLFVARNRLEFFAALEQARGFTPRMATTDPRGLIARLTGIVEGLERGSTAAAALPRGS